MTMFFARSKYHEGCGVTKARAIAGVCYAQVDDDMVPSSQRELTIIEFRPEDFFGQTTDWHNPEKWALDVSTEQINPDEIHRLADLHEQTEHQASIVENESDWRIDYGDDDITYVTKSEDGGIVAFDDHWDQAKESRDQANDWDDGETYWIDDVEGELNLALTPVDDDPEIEPGQ